MERIAVLGPGGVGGFLAGALERAGTPVTLVAREPTAELIARDGLRVESVRLGDFTAHPRTVARLDEDVDILIVATKAGGLRDALKRIAVEPAMVVPLLNGLDHVAALRETYGKRVIAGTIRIEADRPEPGHIVHTSPFLGVELAADDRAAPTDLMEALRERLEAAEVPAKIGSSEAAILWGKLVRLNALACTTSAYDLPIGPIRSTPEMRDELAGCVREAVAIAVAEGAEIKAADVIRELDATHETLGSSMQRDIAAGREPELDAIPGAVMRAGARHGLETPTISRLAARIAERAGVEAPHVTPLPRA